MNKEGSLPRIEKVSDMFVSKEIAPLLAPFFSITEFTRLFFVSKQWHKILDTDECWKQIYIEYVIKKQNTKKKKDREKMRKNTGKYFKQQLIRLVFQKIRT